MSATCTCCGGLRQPLRGTLVCPRCDRITPSLILGASTPTRLEDTGYNCRCVLPDLDLTDPAEHGDPR